MATLTVWKFHGPEDAEATLDTVKGLAREHVMELQDAAVVSWPQDKRKPKTRQLRDLTGPAALGGTFWGLLFGILFFVPLLGAAVGAAAGALTGSLTDVGVDDDFVKRIRERVTPGTSALFLLTSEMATDRVTERLQPAGEEIELLYTNLSSEQEEKLRELFGAD